MKTDLAEPSTFADSLILMGTEFQSFLDFLTEAGYSIIGPQKRGDQISLGPLHSVSQLPQGWIDHQEPKKYWLEKTPLPHFFGSLVSAHSWKQFLFPANEKILSVSKSAGQLQFVEPPLPIQKLALLGIRACDAKAISIQDQVFMPESGLRKDSPRDSRYFSRRTQALLIGTECIRSTSTCFCTSQSCGPALDADHPLVDIRVTEWTLPEHTLLIKGLTSIGKKLLEQMTKSRPCQIALPRDEKTRLEVVNLNRDAIQQNNLELPLHQARAVLASSMNHPHWSKVGERCLSCANCTLVCPTCFCHQIDDVTDLSGDNAERWKRWDSCFNMDHSVVHGKPVHASTPSRYRQWLTHKLSTWHDQFDQSGCTGCGRCVTWCPAGIDLRQELQNFLPVSTQTIPTLKSPKESPTL